MVPRTAASPSMCAARSLRPPNAGSATSILIRSSSAGLTDGDDPQVTLMWNVQVPAARRLKKNQPD